MEVLSALWLVPTIVVELGLTRSVAESAVVPKTATIICPALIPCML